LIAQNFADPQFIKTVRTVVHTGTPSERTVGASDGRHCQVRITSPTG
jgi:hypothetical protein